MQLTKLSLKKVTTTTTTTTTTTEDDMAPKAIGAIIIIFATAATTTKYGTCVMLSSKNRRPVSNANHERRFDDVSIDVTS